MPVIPQVLMPTIFNSCIPSAGHVLNHPTVAGCLDRLLSFFHSTKEAVSVQTNYSFSFRVVSPGCFLQSGITRSKEMNEQLYDFCCILPRLSSGRLNLECHQPSINVLCAPHTSSIGVNNFNLLMLFCCRYIRILS